MVCNSFLDSLRDRLTFGGPAPANAAHYQYDAQDDQRWQKDHGCDQHFGHHRQTMPGQRTGAYTKIIVRHAGISSW
jgi:hypothetical protein